MEGQKGGKERDREGKRREDRTKGEGPAPPNISA